MNPDELEFLIDALDYLLDNEANFNASNMSVKELIDKIRDRISVLQS